MKIKKGDTVHILIGKNRGKSGKVLRVFPKDGRVVVEGVNVKKRHVRPRRSGEKGQIVEVEGHIPVSNVQIACPGCRKPSRVGYKITEEGKVRVCKKCGQTGI